MIYLPLYADVTWAVAGVVISEKVDIVTGVVGTVVVSGCASSKK